MGTSTPPLDLIALVADKNTEYALKGLLARPERVGIRPITANVFAHPERDPGCLLRAPDFLRPLRDQYAHALVMLDREGSGRDHKTRLELEADLETRLRTDWKTRAAAVVLDPELENWVWSDSPHVAAILGWQSREPDLRTWLAREGLWHHDVLKPPRPKEAVERALRAALKPRSSALYRQLAEKVSLNRCSDPAFAKLGMTLREWFPAGR